MPDNSGSNYYLIIDQGTSSTKCFLFDPSGNVVFSERIKHSLHRPASHHVECDPVEILQACEYLIQLSIDHAKENSFEIHSIGFAFQRSTFLFWHKESLKPLSPTLSWQDSRASEIEGEYAQYSDMIHSRCGVPLSSHFGGLKYQHLIRNNDQLQIQTERGEALYGTLSSFLIHTLTGTPAIDHTIAGRTQLMNIRSLIWDEELCSLFQIDQHILPKIVPSTGQFGVYKSIPITCVIGDQQSALIGQGGFHDGFLAMNFGTSGSVLLNSGNKPNQHDRLLTNVLFSEKDAFTYLLEGSINACNSLFYWLETELGIPHEQMVWHKRCTETQTNGVLIPGFSGLAAPYWKSGFDTVFHNLESADHNEIIRAGMESIGLLVHDILKTMNIVLNEKMIPVSGGGARPPLLQFIADLTGVSIGHTAMKDRTAFGVFKLLKKAAGESIVNERVECDQIFTPKMGESVKQLKLEQWHSALKKMEIL